MERETVMETLRGAQGPFAFLGIVLMVVLAYIVAAQVNDTRTQVLVNGETIKQLRREIDDLQHHVPITDTRLTVLEHAVEIQ